MFSHADAKCAVTMILTLKRYPNINSFVIFYQVVYACLPPYFFVDSNTISPCKDLLFPRHVPNLAQKPLYLVRTVPNTHTKFYTPLGVCKGWLVVVAAVLSTGHVPTRKANKRL